MKHHSTPRRRPTPRQKSTTKDKSTNVKNHRATPRHIEHDMYGNSHSAHINHSSDNYRPVHADHTSRYDRRLDPSYRGNPLRLPSLIISVVAIAIAMIASVIYTTIPSEAEPALELYVPQNETTPKADTTSSEQAVSHETFEAPDPAWNIEENFASIENSMRESPNYTACFLALGAWEGYPGLDDIYWQIIADAGIDQSKLDAPGEVAKISEYFKANPDALQSTADQISVVLRESIEASITAGSSEAPANSPEAS